MALKTYVLYHWTEPEDLDAYSYVESGSRGEDELKRDYPTALPVWRTSARDPEDASRKFRIHMGLAPAEE